MQITESGNFEWYTPIQYIESVANISIVYEVYIYRRNDGIVEDRSQKYFFKIDF